MDRTRALAASRDEVRRLASQRLSEVTPSRRDFAQYVATQKQDLAVIACLSAVAPPRTMAELIVHARACDDAEVAALVVAAGAGGLSMDDLAAIAAATTAPIWRDALIVAPSQLYDTRLHGGDAALFPASELDDDTLQELVTVASSLHMASVIEVMTAADVARAVRLPHVILGLQCMHAGGALDVARTRQLAQQVPRQWTVIAVPEVQSAAECAALRGLCDSVVVGAALVGVDDVPAVLQQLTAG